MKIPTLLWLLLASMFLPGMAQPARDGIADLRSYDFSQDAAYLTGTWNFYPNEFVSPDSLDAFAEKKLLLRVPGSWHRQIDFPVIGYATYQVTLILPTERPNLSMYFPIINSAGKIWINGDLVKETGKVSTRREGFVPALAETMIPLPVSGDTLSLVIHVANFVYFAAGIGGYPIVKDTHQLFRELNRDNGMENFFAGSLVAMFLYQLMLFLLFDRGRPYLWLALICLGVALRALIVHGGSFLLPNLYPQVDWEVWKKIEFGAVYVISALFPLYVRDLFYEHAPRRPVLWFAGVALVMLAIVIATPQYVYGNLLDVAHIALLFGFIYAVYSITKAWRAGNVDARIILFGVLASFPFILLEIIQNTRLMFINVAFNYMVEMGVLVFLLFQVYLLAHHYAKSFRNLERLNASLEEIIETRTGELISANSIKDRLLSIMSHDVKSPLNSLRGLLEMYNKGQISKAEFDEFTRHVEGDLGKTSMLVDNILHWTATQLKGVSVSTEQFDVNQLVHENVLLFQTIASKKRVGIVHKNPERLIVTAEKNILNLVLRNLLSNAVKFSHPQGHIYIHVQLREEMLEIRVQDEGVGIDTESIAKLMNPMKAVSKPGTADEKGTGLGISLCREYLEKVNGRLEVESELGKGSTFIIKIPALLPEKLAKEALL